MNENTPIDWPIVSVVVLNFNGKRHLLDCFHSLAELDYPGECRELILVDNASTDGSVEFVQEHFPEVSIIQNGDNLGFAAGNNRGAQAARGEYIVFLNNDTRVDPQFLRELVKPCLIDKDVACTGAKMINWDGHYVDFVSAVMNFHGFGFQSHVGSKDTFHAQTALLFACGGAMLVRRNVFLDSGGFDEDYFIYFEDVDLGWRLWLMGYRVLLVPSAIVYHRLHATMNFFNDFRKAVLFERNALVTILKNYDDQNLEKVLPAALLLMFKRANRMLQAGGWHSQPYSILDTSQPGVTENVNRSAIAVVVAANEVIDDLPQVFEKRARVQASRKRSDGEIFKMFGQPLRSHQSQFTELDEQYSRAHFTVAQQFGITALFANQPRRVLVISSDLLPLPNGPTTGAGLRAWSLGCGLRARGHDVVFSMPRAAMVGRELQTVDPLADFLWEPGRLGEVIRRAEPEVVVACGWSTLAHLSHCDLPIVLDQHGPHLLERQFQQHLDSQTNAGEKVLGMSKADFFTCAGDRQRQYFLPWLKRAGFSDPERQSATVPVSLGGDWGPIEEKEGEPVFIYGGVFLPWQDPALALTTLVERMELLKVGRLRIFGGEHPFIPIDISKFSRLREQLARSPRVEVSPMVGRDMLLKEYQRSHVAIDLMRRNAERELAFTTRTVEYLWCGLPVIYNDYAELADYIRAANAGWCLDPEDRVSMISVFDDILLHPDILRERSQNARQLAQERLNWTTTIEPLDRFCRMPYRRQAPAPMKAEQPSAEQLHTEQPASAKGPPGKGLRQLLGEAAFHYRRGGIRILTVELLGFVQRKIAH